MIYKEKFKIGLKDILKNSEINNKAILEYLEDVASYHSDSVGYGINSNKNSHLTWILLDWKIKVIKRPKYGQTLNISTWSREIIKYYAYRDFEIRDEENNLCVIATSKWILIDNKRGKITKADKEMLDTYDSEPDKSVFKERKIEKIKEPENYISSIIYKANRKDIDIIGHMHNIYYLDLAYEALPEEIYEKRPFNEIQIMYKKEIKLGEEVICKYYMEEDKHIIVIENKTDAKLHAIIELR